MIADNHRLAMISDDYRLAMITNNWLLPMIADLGTATTVVAVPSRRPFGCGN
jgi:hypothetical protein